MSKIEEEYEDLMSEGFAVIENARIVRETDPDYIEAVRSHTTPEVAKAFEIAAKEEANRRRNRTS